MKWKNIQIFDGATHVRTLETNEIKNNNIKTYFLEMYHKDEVWIELALEHVWCFDIVVTRVSGNV
jgi:hypothetical protein